MTLDRRYIPAFSIETVIFDKDIGEPLSNGEVTFYQDNQRATLKSVWQISGTSPDYTFTLLPNPMTLSSIGTFVDGSGNPVVPYFLPFDSEDNPEYYYVTVESEGGVEQFRREAVPYIIDLPATTDEASSFTNVLTNPQFVEVNFDTFSSSHTYNFSGASLESVNIAPGWELVVTGTGGVEVERLNPAGSTNRPTNAPYFLKITSSGSISILRLRQRLYQDPSIWAGTWLSAQMTGRSSSEVTFAMRYEDSDGNSTTLLSDTFPSSGAYGTISDNTQLGDSTSPDSAPEGYVDIIIDLQTSVETEISSIQVVPTNDQPVSVIYNQTPRNRQLDQAFNYYKSQLQEKPIPSWLVGWEFPKNPSQFGETKSAGGSANQSRYVWDQTIVYQNKASGVTTSRGDSGSLRLTANVNTQAAIVQYLDSRTAKALLADRLSVNVTAKASSAVNATISLYYTTGGSLPTLTSGFGNSLISTIGSNGKPTALQGPTWTEVPRGSNGDAVFEIETNPTSGFNDYMFSEWDATAQSAIKNATFFAIVIGTSEITSSANVQFLSASLCSGDMATRPAPKSPEQTLQECEYYWESSFASGTVPATTANGALFSPMNEWQFQGTDKEYRSSITPFDIRFNTLKRASPSITLYSTISNTASKVLSFLEHGSTTVDNERDISEWASPVITKKNVHYGTPSTIVYLESKTHASPSFEPATAYIKYQYIADARLGI